MAHGEVGAGWLSADEWLVLAELLFGGRPRGMADVVTAVHADPTSPGALSRRWVERQRRLLGVFLGLYRRGLITEAVSDGECTSDVYRLTAAGRRAVTGAAQLWRRPGTTLT